VSYQSLIWSENYGALRSILQQLLTLLKYNIFRLRNDLYCVEWGVKLYSLTQLHEKTHFGSSQIHPEIQP